jgi:hypothetical protein
MMAGLFARAVTETTFRAIPLWYTSGSEKFAVWKL